MDPTITPLIQSYIVDFASNNNFLFVKGVQGDGHSTRYVDITLMNNGQPYELGKDITVVIRGTKPDGKEIFNPCEILDSNTIRVEITQQISAVSGKGSYEISVMSIKENKLLTSFPFFIIISASSFDIGYVTSSNEFKLLLEKIRLAEEANKKADQLIVKQEELKEELEETIDTANDVIDNAVKATTDCINATDEMKQLHQSLQDAEEIRNQNENIRIENENERIKNTEKALKAIQSIIGDVQGDLGLDDESSSLVTTWSSEKIQEQTQEWFWRKSISNLTIPLDSWSENKIYIKSDCISTSSVIDIYYNQNSLHMVSECDVRYTLGDGWLCIEASYAPYEEIVIDNIMIENYSKPVPYAVNSVL